MPRRKKTSEDEARTPAEGTEVLAETNQDSEALQETDETGEGADAREASGAVPGGATEREAANAVPAIERMVLFLLGGRQFALPIDDVQEIQQIVALTEFPDASPALIGMVNLRGAVVPVIDLRSLLGVEQKRYTLETPMIVCRRGGGLVALVVDEVEDVMELPADCLQPASRLYEHADKLLGVCRLESGLVFLLDLTTLIPEEDLAMLTAGEGAVR